jgi:hypothetical protein
MMPTDLVGKKTAISVMFDVVTIEIHCGGDEYLARVLYDDLIERMRSGEGISLGLKPKTPITEHQ